MRHRVRAIRRSRGELLGSWPGFVMLLLLAAVLATLSTGASALRTQRGLQQAADAAALAGAMAIDEDQYAVHGLLGPDPIDADEARDRVIESVAVAPGEGRATVEQVHVEGADVRVHLSMPLFPDPPGAHLGLWAHARSHATLVYRDPP